MSIARNTLAALALLSLPAMPAAAQAPRPLTGAWTSDFGTLTLLDREGEITGSYDTDDGRITGTFDGAVLQGFWIESKSDYTCDTPRMGSRHWGRIRFELNSARTGWTGIWSYCDYEFLEGNVWNGRRAPR